MNIKTNTELLGLNRAGREYLHECYQSPSYICTWHDTVVIVVLSFLAGASLVAGIFYLLSIGGA